VPVKEAHVASPRILIVEDETLIAMMEQDFLTDLGWEVAGSACTLDRALAMVRDLDIDAALLDVNLHGKNTFAAADILGERNIPFVFATGYGLKGVADRFPGVPMLTKPFRSNDLDRALRLAMGATDGSGCAGLQKPQTSPGKSSWPSDKGV
jgi:CheY-like chemotaxis protein